MEAIITAIVAADDDNIPRGYREIGGEEDIPADWPEELVDAIMAGPSFEEVNRLLGSEVMGVGGMESPCFITADVRCGARAVKAGWIWQGQCEDWICFYLPEEK